MLTQLNGKQNQMTYDFPIFAFGINGNLSQLNDKQNPVTYDFPIFAFSAFTRPKNAHLIHAANTYV